MGSNELLIFDERLKTERDHWLKRLAGAPASASLREASARVDTAAQPETLPLEVPAGLQPSLQALTKGNAFLTYVTIMAAVKVTMLRYTGQRHVAVASPRRRQEGQAQGRSNVLVVATTLRETWTGQQLLMSVRKALLDAYAHQDYPFARLQQDLARQGALREPLFELSLALAGFHEPLDAALQGDLAVQLDLADGHLAARASFDAAVHPADWVRRFWAHALQVLQALLAAPAQPIDRLELITDEERRLLSAWNDTRAPFPDDTSLIHLFAAQAARTPDAPALRFDGQTLDYRQLQERAGHIARALRERGVGPEVRVGLCLERSFDLVAAMLGVLQAGGAFVPMDPAYPRDRLAYMARDAGVRLVVTSAHLSTHLATPVSTPVADRLPEDTGRLLLESLQTEGPAPTAPLAPVGPDSAAYVIYTSGSTGRPKGVVVAHRSTCNLVDAVRDALRITPHSRVLQFASFSFDAIVWEVFPTLLSGATLVLAPQHALIPGPGLLRLMREQAITLATLPPSALAAMPVEALPALATLVVAGETCPPALAAAWGPGRRFVDAYGPTENTVCATIGPWSGERERLSIGRPIQNVRVHVLDGRMRPVPAGIPGELYIGGAGLARGYLKRPALTAERFVPDPFATDPGARLYRTGDMARWRQDGRLDFLGREDHQVKVRGYRIELEEIEAALGAHEQVRQAAVVVRRDMPGGAGLVAYVALRGGKLTAADLRASLQERLPDYMVPGAFVFLDALPLTAPGKIDRGALPAPASVRGRGEGSYVPPRTPIEELLGGIWAEVLDLAQVGAEDHFFHLGGHSLLATRVTSRIKEALGVDLPLETLFEHPVLSAFARKVDALVAQAGAAAPEASPAASAQAAPATIPGPQPRAPRDQPLPLSLAQQRLWFLDRLAPDSAYYNVPGTFRLHGRLDLRALEQAFQELVRRHEVLRTSFHDADGVPWQRIEDDVELALHLDDLRELPAAAREAAALRVAAQEEATPFDLGRAPLLRVRLVRVDDELCFLLITLHHIVSDGWSLGVLAHELSALYEAFSRQQPSPLPPLPLQYADFACWQREALGGQALADSLAYWRNQLAGAPPWVELPTDHARPAIPTYRGASCTRVLPARLLRALESLGRSRGSTLFMTLLAGFLAQLHRYSGQGDLVVGSPVAGRRRTELEPLIGMFVNTLVLRASVADDPGFLTLLARVRRAALEAYAHQDVPFEQLVDALQPERMQNRTPLFNVLFALQNAPMEPLRLPGVTFSPVEVPSTTAAHDLSLSMQAQEQGLYCHLEYDLALFEHSTAQRMLAHFELLLEGVAAAPETRISALPLLTPAERHQVLVAPNHTRASFLPFPIDQACIHQLIAAQAARTPDAPAVSCDHDALGCHTLSYRALAARARGLARRLRRLGVGPEIRVALCVERSVDMVAGMLGILEAGGAYVPLDPAYPRERLAHMLQDSQAAVVLVQQKLADALPAHGLPVLYLDTDADADAGADADMEAAAPPVSAGNLAYMLYTSGSTGVPKGVMVPHRTVCNLFAALDGRLGDQGPGDVWLAVASVSFDVSVAELLWTLTRGFHVVIQRDTRELGWLARQVQRHGVTHVQCTPALARVLLTEDGTAAALERLQRMIVTGEALPVDLAQMLLAHLPGGKLLDLYGPTETTVWSSLHPVREAESSIPLGTPLANTALYVLDRHLQPVPLGVPGELYIGGQGVVRGYHARFALTAERFLPDPFYGQPGARMYRTGDLVRRRADGALEFLGRTDFQVKVRGFRIELGEIEAALAKQPGVHAAVVVAREDAGDKQLVAYVQPAQDHPLAPEDLRQALRRRLPEHMVPTAWCVLPALPLTPSGKVDRKALPAPHREHALHAPTFVAPRTPTEQVLASVFAQILHLERVGVDDDFFALGGHSLLGMQLVARVRASLGVELPLRALFEAPTIAALARRLHDAAQAQMPPLQPGPRAAEPPLSFAQQRMWFIDRFAPGNPSYNLPLVLRLEGRLDVDALRRAFDHLIERHEALRTSFASREGRPFQVIHAPAAWELPVVDLTGAVGAVGPAEREARAHARAVEEAQTPFDLGAGPLLRTVLLRLAPDAHLLLVTIHHIIADGWSLGVLVRELAAAYQAHAAGRAPALPPLPVQYADYAAWQRQWLQDHVLAEQIAWWKQQLAGVPHALALPTDRPRPPVQSFRGASLPVHLPGPLWQRLEALARAEGATPFMVLLAAWQVLLARYAGQHDFLVGTPIAGRTRAETEGLIGLFVNMLALRARVDGAEPFRALLARVRATTLAAYEHQDLPFEKLVEELQPRRDLGRSPLFQVMLALQNTPSETVALPDLGLRQEEVDGGTAHFDLTLVLAESGDGLRGVLNYATDLFEPATAERMASHFLCLLQAALDAPERPVATLPMLSPAEVHQVLVAPNHTRAPFPIDQACIHQLIAAQAARTPDAPAVSCDHDALGCHTLSYRALTARARDLARRLRRLGVGPEVRVALCVERSVDMVAGMLGILEAGGAYVPLDPAYPRERLAHMLQDSQAAVVLVQQKLAGVLPAHGLPVLYLDTDADADTDTDADADADMEAAATARPVGAGNLAYVIYTSGSTGRPKGVLVPHRNACNLFAALDERLGEQAASGVWLAVASVSFDMSVVELLWTLTRGFHVVIQRDTRERGWLARQVQRHGVTHIQCTPTLARMLLAEDGTAAALGHLQQMLIGAEALPPALARSLLAHLPGGGLINIYGPTEITVWASAHPVREAEPSIPLGTPLANTALYVLDPYLQPVPLGVPGELYIGGQGVVRGYHARPALTAERFLPDPFYGQPGARMYRTGDLVRRRADGALEFLGRADFQVKVRGFRIELGEIEAALAAQPGVHAAVVVARDDAGDKQLVAYVQPAQDHPLAPEDLRQALRRRLPEYMVPTAWCVLPALPLTPSGKVDRKALPAPAQPARARRVAPRDALEQTLARIWAQVLQVPDLGMDDDFFDLGGHSLLAVQLMAHIERELGRALPVSVLFQRSTVAQLAALVRSRTEAGDASTDADANTDAGTDAGAGTDGPAPALLVPLQPGSGQRPLFCVHPIGGSVLCYRDLVRALGPERPVWGLEAPALHGGPAEDRIGALAARYLAAVRQVQPRGPYLLGGWSFGGAVAFDMARQLERQGEQAVVVLVDAVLPPPGLAPPSPGEDAADMVRDLARLAGAEQGPALERLCAQLHASAPADAGPAALLDRLRRGGWLPPDAGVTMVQALLDTYGAHRRALRSYHPDPCHAPVLLVRAQHTAAELAARGLNDGWARVALGPLHTVDMPGDHYTLLRPPLVQTLAGHLQACLSDVDALLARAAGHNDGQHAGHNDGQRAGQ